MSRYRDDEIPWVLIDPAHYIWACRRCDKTGQVPTNVNTHTWRCFQDNLKWEHRLCAEKLVCPHCGEDPSPLVVVKDRPGALDGDCRCSKCGTWVRSYNA